MIAVIARNRRNRKTATNCELDILYTSEHGSAHRDFRVVIHQLETVLFPGETARKEIPGVLWHAAQCGGVERDFPADADSERDRRVGWGDAPGFPFCRQGAPVDHAF